MTGLFQAVDIAGTALRTAAIAEEQDLAPCLIGAFSELAALFGEFAVALVSARLRLESLHQEVREEAARQSADRERARRAEADIGRILDAVRDLQTRAPCQGPASSRSRVTAAVAGHVRQITVVLSTMPVCPCGRPRRATCLRASWRTADIKQARGLIQSCLESDIKIVSARRAAMRTVIDIDDDALRLAAEELGTTTKVATVNAALRKIAEQRASRLMTADLLRMDLDLDDDTMRGAWRH